MERRQHPRIPVNSPVRVTTLLGDCIIADGQLEQLSGAGARVTSPVPLQPGTPLRLDLPDTLLLGECVYCQAVDGGFTLGIHLEHSLGSVGELRRLMSALMQEVESPNSAGSRLAQARQAR